MDLRLVPAAALAWAGAAWWSEATSRWSIGGAIVLIAVGAVLRRRHWIALTLCLVAVVAVSCAWRVARVEASPVSQAAAEHRSGTFDLRVRRDAVVFDRHGREQAVVDVTIRRAQIDGVSVEVDVPATAFVDDAASDLVVGRSFTAVGRLAPADSRQEAAVIDVVRRERARSGGWLWEAADRVRAGVRTAASTLPDGPKALLPALIDGDRTAVTEDMEQDFQRTGLTHLMAVSGTNLTIVLAVVLALIRAAGAGRRITWAAAAFTVVAFIAVARPDPSVLRAAAMGIVGLAALGYGGRGGLRALSVAVLSLVFLDPWLARSAGFVLSVCATGGILLLGPPFTARLTRWMPRWLAIAIAVPFAAQVACTPAIAAISGEVSLVAVAANLVAGPVVAPATVLGLSGGLIAVVSPAGGQIVAWPAGVCAAWIVEVAARGAQLSGASIGWSLPWQALLIAVPIVTGLCWAAFSRPAVAIGLAAGLIISMVRPPSPGWPPDGWIMVACDVGQGDATVLNVVQGTAIVVDAGPDPRLVDECLDRLGVHRVALAVMTHAHADHVDGWSGVRRGRRVDAVVGGPTSAALRQVRAGETFSVGGVRGLVVWPPVDAPVPSADSSGEGSAVNDASVVMRVELDGIVLMLTGDVEPDAQDQILRSGLPVDADVLKMPHHGSARQSEQFLDAVGARVVTVSAGQDNDYGHPAPAALRMLRERGAAAWRTDLDGDIAIVVRDGRLSIVTRR